MTPHIRVFLLGRQWLFTEPIATLLSASPGIDLAGSTTNPADVFDAIRSQLIDVLLLDANLHQGDAAQLTRSIRAEKPYLKLIVFGLESLDEVILEFIEAGANGCISHESSFKDLVRLIEQVYEGRTTCSPRTAALVFERITRLSRQNGFQRQTREVALTPREEEILQLIAAGLSNKQIAEHLQISLFTVKNHIHNLFEKLQVSYRLEAIRYAQEHGLIKRPWQQQIRPMVGRVITAAVAATASTAHPEVKSAKPRGASHSSSDDLTR